MDAPRGTEPPLSAAPPAPEKAAEVVAFLRAHPTFLRDQPELLAELLPARDLGEGVSDLQAHALTRLRREVEELRSGARELIHTARFNMNTQADTHTAVLALLAAESFDALVRTITDDLPRLLKVDLVMLCCETGLPKGAAIYVQELQAGAVKRLMGPGNAVRLRANTQIEKDTLLYGEGSELICSDALVRLPYLEDHGLPPTLLALGSRQAGTFHEGQATDLLTFLAAVTAQSIRRWVAP